MSNVIIPLSLFDDPTFSKLQPGDLRFLLCLYAEFHDTERFTIDLKDPSAYRQSGGAWLVNRVNRLCKKGFIEVVDKQEKRKKGYRGFVRVFSLKHK